MTMQTRILKKLGWNVYNLWTINYFNNQKREINKIKEVVATLTEKKVVSKKPSATRCKNTEKLIRRLISNRWRAPGRNTS